MTSALRLLKFGCYCIALLLSGCQTTVPGVGGPYVLFPKNYGPESTAVKASDSDLPLINDWWKNYGSDELNALVDRALANNSDLRIATLQLVQAKLRASQTQAGGTPTVTAPLQSVVQRSRGGADGQQSSQAGLQGVYRLDLWGEQKSLNASAEYQIRRAVHERENVQRTIVGNLVSYYVSFLTANDALSLALENESVAKEILQSVERRMAAGDATQPELELQRATLFAQQGFILGLKNQREDIVNLIARLVGMPRDGVVLANKGLDELQIPVVPHGLPSRLLLMRPDVRLVESRMLAAKANIDVARARLFPSVDLSLQAGYSAIAMAELLQPQSILVNAIASVSLAVFDGGRREAEEAIAKAYHEEMVESYVQVLMQSLREVEGAMTSLKSAQSRLESQRAVTRASLNMFKLASDAYTLGAADLFSLLDARRSYQRTLDDLQRAKSEVLRGYITLTQALGYGTDIAGPTVDGKGADGFQIASTREGTITFAEGDVSLSTGLWSAEIQGLVHRSALMSHWRDMRTWDEVALSKGFLQAKREGGISESMDEKDSWYRISVGGFGDKAAAARFCAHVNKLMRGCEVKANG